MIHEDLHFLVQLLENRAWKLFFMAEEGQTELSKIRAALRYTQKQFADRLAHIDIEKPPPVREGERVTGEGMRLRDRHRRVHECDLRRVRQRRLDPEPVPRHPPGFA